MHDFFLDLQNEFLTKKILTIKLKINTAIVLAILSTLFFLSIFH